MPTTYTDQFFVMDPAAPPPVGTPLNFQLLNLIDNNDDGDVDRFNNDSVDGSDVTSSYPGDTVTIRLPDNSLVTYTGITFYLADGRQVFTPIDGQVLQAGTFWSSTFVNGQGPLDEDDLGPVCFTPGTLIETAEGLRPIETLRAGDRVRTRDNGLQALRWIGTEDAAAEGEYAPVVFAPGVLGNPADLVVSQQHRVLVTGWRAQLFAGEDEVLVAARHLVNGRDVVLREGGRVTYVHILFDRHEIVRAGGVWSESYFPAHAADHQRREMAGLFPAHSGPAVMQAARLVAKRHEAACLVA